MNKKNNPQKGKVDDLPKNEPASTIPKTFQQLLAENRVLIEQYSKVVDEYVRREIEAAIKKNEQNKTAKKQIKVNPICTKCDHKKTCLMLCFPERSKREICQILIDAAKKQNEIVYRPSNLSMDEMLDFILEHKN